MKVNDDHSMNLFNGDCLEKLKLISDNSIDLILADPPYGITECAWDKVIPFEPLWEELNRVAKQNTAFIIFGVEPFSSQLRMSNLKNYRYDLIYEKPHATGFLNVNRQPMRAHENISVFYRKQPTYNPQKTSGHTRKSSSRSSVNSNLYEKAEKRVSYDSTERFPRSVLKFSSDKQTNALHPTQKPIELLKYLIETYSNPNDTVLDFVMGSGSTGTAALMLDRDFVGIELDEKYFNQAEEWLNQIKNFELVS